LAIGEFFETFAASFTPTEYERTKKAALIFKNRFEISPPALKAIARFGTPETD
jgi:hypothetical protein